MIDNKQQQDLIEKDKSCENSKLCSVLYREFVEDSDIFYWIFLLGGIITQTVTFFVSGLTALSYVSGLCGICSVLLCSRRKISMYVFGFLQILTYMVLAYQQRLYGEIAINVFYLVTMVYGCFAWSRSYDEGIVEPKILSVTTHIVIGIFTFFSIFIVWRFLATYTNDTQPFMDSLTTVPALAAQILMVTRCKEQWWYWLVVDVAATYMWFVAADWCMVAQYLFWIGNCIYGQYKWSK